MNRKIYQGIQSVIRYPLRAMDHQCVKSTHKLKKSRNYLPDQSRVSMKVAGGCVGIAILENTTLVVLVYYLETAISIKTHCSIGHLWDM